MFEGKEESRADESDGELHFYYNREERLKHAPRNVQDYYNGNFVLQKGIRRVMWGNRSNRFLLLTLFALTAFAVVFGIVDKSQAKGKIGDYKIELISFSYEDEVYSTLKATYAGKKTRNEQSDVVGDGGQSSVGKATSQADRQIGRSGKRPVVLSVEFRAVNIDNQVVDIKKEERLLQNDEENFRTKITDFDIAEMRVIVNDGNDRAELYTDVKK